MRIYRFLHQIVMRFSGMEEGEGSELAGEAKTAYDETLRQAKNKSDENKAIGEKNLANADNKDYKRVPEKELTKEEKIILQLEKWPVRYGIAVAYIALVPKIKDYYEGGDDEEDAAMVDPGAFMAMYSMMMKAQNFNKK